MKSLLFIIIIVITFSVFGIVKAEGDTSGDVLGDRCSAGSSGFLRCIGSDILGWFTCEYRDWPSCAAHFENIAEEQKKCRLAFEDTGCDFPFGSDEDYWDYFSSDCYGNLEGESEFREECCPLLSDAKACDNKIKREEEAFDECQAADDYVWKLLVEAPCIGCIGGETPTVCQGGSLPVFDPSTENNTFQFDPVQALIDKRPKREDFPLDDDWLREGSDFERKTGIPYGPFISNAQSHHNLNYRITIQDKSGHAKFILPDGTELDTAYISSGQTAIIPAGTRVVTPPGSFLNFRIDLIGTPKTDDYHEFEMLLSYVRMDYSSEIEIQEIYRGFLNLKAKKGFVRFFRRGIIQLAPASETGVMLGTKGTDFGIAYYPDTKQTIIEVYDGTVDIFFQSENVLTTISTDYDSDIKRVEIASNGVIEEKIAVIKDEFEVSQEIKEEEIKEEKLDTGFKTRSNTGWFVLLAIIAIICAGIGLFVYKKGILNNFFKKD